MSVEAVLRKDFKDGIRSYLLWGLTALFVLSIGGFSLVATSGGATESEGDLQLIGLMGLAAVFALIVLIPITGLVVSIKSITRERELGRIKVMLSLPHTRLEVVVGKFLGRAGLLTTAILAGFVPAGLVFAAQVDNFPVAEYVMFVIVAILFGLVFVAVGIGVSALLNTETQATVAGVGAFFLLYFWNGIVGWINGQLDLVSTSSDLWLFVQRFHLFNVFVDAFLALLSLTQDVGTNASIVTAGQGGGLVEDSVAEATMSQPIFLQQWFVFVILAIWIVVPLAVGYARFKRVDL